MRFFNKYFFVGFGSGIILTILLLVLTGFLLFKFAGPNEEKMRAMLRPPEFPSVQKASAFDEAGYWILWTLEGDEVRFSKLEGKVIFINLWATWCQPCVLEMPSIQVLYETFKGEVVFLIASKEGRDKVREFYEDNNFTFPVYLVDSSLPEIFQTRGIPATFIIDRNGNLVFQHVGSADWSAPSCFDFIRNLL